MKLGAVDNLPLKDELGTAPTGAEAFRAVVGMVALLLGAVAMLATFCTYSLPMLAACLGFYVIGAGCLWGCDWLMGNPRQPVCDDCGEVMHQAGDVWVCWHCTPGDGM